MTPAQSELLSAFAMNGGPLLASTEASKRTCDELVAMGMLRTQSFIDGSARVGEAKVTSAYQITAKGRKAAESCAT